MLWEREGIPPGLGDVIQGPFTGAGGRAGGPWGAGVNIDPLGQNPFNLAPYEILRAILSAARQESDDESHKGFRKWLEEKITKTPLGSTINPGDKKPKGKDPTEPDPDTGIRDFTGQEPLPDTVNPDDIDPDKIDDLFPIVDPDTMDFRPQNKDESWWDWAYAALEAGLSWANVIGRGGSPPRPGGRKPTGQPPGPIVKDPDPVIKPDPDPITKDPGPVVKDPGPVIKDPEPIVKGPDPVLDPVVKNPSPGINPDTMDFRARAEGESWIDWALAAITAGLSWLNIFNRNPPRPGDIEGTVPSPDGGVTPAPPGDGTVSPGDGTVPSPGDVITPPPDNTATPPPNGDTMPPDDDKNWTDWLEELIPLLPILFPPDDPDPGGTSVTQIPPPGQNEILGITLPILEDFIKNPPEIQPRPVHPFTPLELQGHESILGAIPGIRGQMDFLQGQQQETAGAQKYFQNVRGGTHALGQALAGLGQQQGPQQYARQWAGQPYGNPRQPQKAASPSGGLGKLLRGGQ